MVYTFIVRLVQRIHGIVRILVLHPQVIITSEQILPNTHISLSHAHVTLYATEYLYEVWGLGYVNFPLRYGR